VSLRGERKEKRNQKGRNELRSLLGGSFGKLKIPTLVQLQYWLSLG